MIGTPADDALFGTSDRDTISGLGGHDRISGKSGSDQLSGDEGIDTLLLGKGREHAEGGTDADTIVDDAGGRRPDELVGGPDDDLLASVDSRTDVLVCGDGTADVAFADRGDRTRECETVVVGSGTTVPLLGTSVYGTNRNDTLGGSISPEVIFGRGGQDSLLGNRGSDLLFGGRGRDIFQAGDNQDQLFDDDGTGGDWLLGGEHEDVLHSADGAADTVDCGVGPGDVAYVDLMDTVSECETVFSG